MNITFFLPKYIKGGGELVTISLIKYINISETQVNAFLYCMNSQNIKELDPKFKNELYFDLKSRLLIQINSILFKSVFSNKSTIHVSVLSGMNISIGLCNLIFWQKLIFVEHSNLGAFYFQNVGIVKKTIRKLLYNIALLTSKKLIFVSEQAMSDSIKNIWKIHHNKACVIHNPVFNLREKIKVKSNNYVNIKCLILIGRFSPEKRILEGLNYLKSQNINLKTFLVSEIDEINMNKLKEFNNLTIFSDYSFLPNINLRETLLINFSFVESFSLVIAEWLKVKGLVFSTRNSRCNSIWRKFKGFYEFEENDSFINKLSNLKKFNSSDTRPYFLGRSINDYKNDFLKTIK